MTFLAQKKLKTSCRSFKTIAIMASLAMTLVGNAQTNKQKTDDATLLDSYIQSKGYKNPIVFTSSNIKQFWTEQSVSSLNEMINILLDDGRKKSLRIQLANVDVLQDCRVDIVSKTADLHFSVLSNNTKVISKALQNESFIGYSVKSATFHLEDTNDYSFFLNFTATNSTNLEIERIILSFKKNDSFLSSPGKLIITDTTCSTSNVNKKTKITENSFSLTGVNTCVLSNNKILISDNTVTNSVRVKNIGKKPTNVYLGYAPYTKDGKLINNNNNPYKNNKIMKVISIDKKKNIIVVDSEPEWEKGCRLVLDAKEDLSDFPNHSFVEGTIQDVKKVNDRHFEIVFSQASKIDIKVGTSVRVQSPNGAAFLYTNLKLLQPGEEVAFSAKIEKDDNYILFGSRFCRGTYYVVPVFISITSGSNEENTVQVENFIVGY